MTTIGLEKIREKVDRMRAQIGDKVPHTTKNGVYDNTAIDWWTSGFWPGMLWIMHELTGDDVYKEEAWDWDERLERRFLEENRFHHDVGFQFLPTAVVKYKLTGDADARRRGLAAAAFLAGRFNLAGRFLRAWNPSADKKVWNADNTGWAIVDSSMNLSLLFWASEEIQDPRFAQIAVAHAETVLRWFIREDGSVRHICSFNPETGEFIESIGGQGFGPDSAWSRGASWALHGLANVYRYTGDRRFLEGAQRVAHYFIAACEADGVPLWDFRVTPREGEPRDTSAAACAASGLLELAAAVPAAEQPLYRAAAERIFASLTERYAAWDDPAYEGLLREGTGHKPAGQNINVSLIYGDYYYLETFAKLNGWQTRIF